MLLKPDKSDYISMDFVLCYQIEDICDFQFKVNAQLDAFTYEKNDLWFSLDAIQKFITNLEELRTSRVGKAELVSEENHFFLKIEPHGKNGYLLIRAVIHYQSPQYFGLHSTINTFDGGFFIEPAKLPEWIDELTDIITKREPSTDFLGNWNTSLPLPEWAKKIKNSGKGG